MYAEELRAVLTRLDLSQADFARLLGVTPRSVSQWLAEDGKVVPGPAEAYLRLYGTMPEAARQVEIQRLREAQIGMRDGVFLVVYGSVFPDGGVTEGWAMITLDRGKVFGADVMGGRYDGHYILVDVNVRVTFPPNVMSVMRVSNPYEWSLPLAVSFDPRLNEGTTSITNPLAGAPPLVVKFRYLRGIAAA